MSASFQAAASFLSSSPAASKASNDIKLEYVTTSQGPDASRPSLFDFTGRAKWDAWSQTAKKYADHKEDAEQRYIEIARSFGWSEEAAAPDTKGKEVEVDEMDWDASDDSNAGAKAGGGSGMGPVVSTASAPVSEEDPDTLHAIALSGDTRRLEEFLDKHPDIPVDDPDEFGYTALQLACDRGSLSTVKFLLGRGANPDLKVLFSLS
ncbi:hypothetical protein OE88DRAFT_1722061 [Heliocybe sulcata]|uniref:ACB domain-containing protein n=1 Tax=Heliocybe sulcata TaxID=5364 RepID=A0A5C3NJK3_9AGAM|nr:hypothetical protein OE88DRAFT_1722061 [Heliocybe sulcata]